MIVIDPSAIMSVMLDEPDKTTLMGALRQADRRYLSAGSAIELGIVIESRTTGAISVERVLREFRLEVVAVDEPQMAAAMNAWRRFGKGVTLPA